MRFPSFVFIVLSVLGATAAHASSVDKNSAALVTELVTTSLAKEQRFEVLSSTDVRRQLEIEANKATLGCDADSSSCLAEIAGAMGAQLVVYGKLGTLDDVVILTLNLFDSSQARAVGRVALKEKSLSALSDRVDGGVQELIAPFASKLAAADGKSAPARMKLLVLDIEPPDAGASAASMGAANNAPSEPLSALFWGGVGGLAGGLVVGTVGGVLLAIASSANDDAKQDGVTAVEADAAYDERDTYGGLGLGAVGVGVLALGAGAVMLGMSFTE